MKEFLSENNIDYVEYNVDQDPKALQRMMDVSRHTTIPTIIAGDNVVVGYDAKQLAKLLQ